MTCHSCGAALTAGAKFCRACGTPVAAAPAAPVAPPEPVCPACATPFQAGQRFCRGCGSALATTPPAPAPDPEPLPGDDVETADHDLVAESDTVVPPASFTKEASWDLGSEVTLDRAPTTPLPQPEAEEAQRRACRVCGAPAEWARETCADCGEAEETSATMRVPVEPQPQPTVTPLEPLAAAPQPAAPARSGGHGKTIALVLAAVLVLAGGAAGAFVLTKDPAKASAKAEAPPAKQAAATDPRTDEPSPATTQAQTTATDDADDAPDADDPRTEDPSPADEDAVAKTAAEDDAEESSGPNSPTGVIRAHWAAINEGDYQAAYDLFASQYQARTSASNWIDQESEYEPRVALDQVDYLRSTGDGQALVSVDLFTRDMGSKGDSSTCNRFGGKVKVVKQGGEWRYWALAPGATWQGKGSVSSSDPRCASLF